MGRFRHQAGALAIEVDATDGGRVVEFSLDGENALAAKDTSPQYGSSFWPSPQRDWDWPPPIEFNLMPWRASHDGNTLVLESETNALLGLRAEQRWTPAPSGISVEYRLRNEGIAPRAVAPWENSRVGPSGLTFFPCSEPTLAGSTLHLAPVHGVMWLEHDPATMRENQKAFADGSEGWLAHLHRELLMLKTFPVVPRALQAPTEALVELYVDQSGLFVEVEEQGAYETLLPGGQSRWTVGWQLHRVPTEISRERGSPGLVRWARERAEKQRIVPRFGPLL